MNRIAFRRRGLTLIEIIVVIVIITVLFTITVAAGQYILHSKLRETARVILEEMGSSTMKYRTDRGYWPHQAAGFTWQLELTRKRENNGALRTPYFQAESPVLRAAQYVSTYSGFPTEGFTVIWDPWDVGYDVETGGTHVNANQGMPVFRSAGPNRSLGNADDVFSHCGTDMWTW